jgi:hypothetical protein
MWKHQNENIHDTSVEELAQLIMATLLDKILAHCQQFKTKTSHGFNSHLGGQGVCRSILLKPSGVGGGLSYHVYEYISDLIDLM